MNHSSAAILWVGVSFACGSLPFSLWIGRLALGRDIRTVGDGNPGAFNVFRAGGRLWGALAIALDFLKAAVPVGLASSVAALGGPALALTALAAPAGHAFSPLLRLRGGKALASTFGMWTGLTLWLVPSALGLLFAVWYTLLAVEGWAVIAAMLCLLPLLVPIGEPLLLVIWAGNTALLVWTHRADLRRPLTLRRSRLPSAARPDHES